MKGCKEIRKILNRYLDKETKEEENIFIQKHLNQCLQCKKEYQEIFAIKKMLQEKERLSLPLDYLVFRLRDKLKEEVKTKERLAWFLEMGNFSRRLIPVPLTAIVFLLLFMIFNLRQLPANYSVEDYLLNGYQITSENLIELILGL